ncbi:MAG TPA: hypothetical protein DD435_12195 [Cyanobacteria bacterium UBA8530]|nr:hypothetical protein [Cyanobacteria bacterium UBA8530]
MPLIQTMFFAGTELDPKTRMPLLSRPIQSIVVDGFPTRVHVVVLTSVYGLEAGNYLGMHTFRYGEAIVTSQAYPGIQVPFDGAGSSFYSTFNLTLNKPVELIVRAEIGSFSGEEVPLPVRQRNR